MPGVRTASIENDVLTSRLNVDGQPVITATANVTDKALGTLGGHLNYYAHRQFPTVDGGRAAVNELVELPLPFVADLFEADVTSVEFTFPESHPVSHLAPVSPSAIHSVLYGAVTFTYSMGRVIHDYCQSEPS